MNSSLAPWTQWRVGITGVNALPDDPGPGAAVARCLREGQLFRGEILRLGYHGLEAEFWGDGPGYLLPSPSTRPSVLLDGIQQAHQRAPLDAIIPCLDFEISAFLRIRDQLEQLGIRVLVPRLAALRQRARLNLPELCARLEIAHPRTQAVIHSSFFSGCQNDRWRYPLVLKGACSGAVIVYDEHTARLAFERVGQECGYPVLAQERLAGTELSLTALGDGRGRMLANVCLRKEAVDAGNIWAGMTIVDNELIQLAARFFKSLRWAGPMELEVIKTADGRLWVVGVNPRFPSWVYLSTAVRRNLPEVLLALMSGETTFLFPQVQPGKMLIRGAQETLAEIALESPISTGDTVAPHRH